MANPGKQHWEGVKGILRYLKGTKGQCLCYGGGKPEVSGFVDSDMAGDVDGRKSTTGYVFCFNGGAISWVSRLQQIVALSTTEAEYIAATEACKEAIWLTRLLGDLGVSDTAPILHCDSQSAIQLAKNPVFHARTKHIDIRFHYIREVLEDGLIRLVKIRSEDNPADVCTKSLPVRKLEHCKALMGVRNGS
jgi:ATP-binding cassette subfamily B (MDR/TAP) protein 1